MTATLSRRPRLHRLQLTAIRLSPKAEAPWRVGSQTGEFLYDTAPLDEQTRRERDEEFTWAASKGRRHSLTNGYLSYEKRRIIAPGALIMPDGIPTRALDWIKRANELNWRAMNRRLALSGVPLNTDGAFTGPGAIANAQALAAVTGGTINIAWWTPLTYTPFPGANGLKCPAAYRLTAGGLITSSAAAQTYTMNPAVGTAVAGQVLGASTALALGSTITNAFWRLAYDMVIRTPGTSSTTVGGGLIHWGTTAGASATVSNALFGGGNTVATADIVTSQQALLIAATPSAAGVSVTPTMVQWASWD